jgi:hypothetical protein
MLRPYALMIQYGLLFLLAPVLIEFVLHILNTVLLALWHHGLSSTAPLCWLGGLLVTFWMGTLEGTYDHASNHIHIGFQANLNTHETIKAK